MTQDELKQLAAEAAVKEVEKLIDFESVVGVGTGSTVNFFIEALAAIKGKFDGAVSSSEESTRRLKEKGIPVYDLNGVNEIAVYVDGADEIDDQLQMIKGGGAALTREKIVAAIASNFICIADQSKQVKILGTFPLPVEVIPMARSYVARQIVKIGGDPVYREGVVTDNGNVILDVYNLKIDTPVRMEERLNNIVGVVCNGFFAARPADQLLLATADGIVSTKK